MSVGVTLEGTPKDPMVAAILGDGAIAIDLSGPVDGAKKTADLRFGVKAGKITLSGGVRTTGDDAFLQLNDKWYALPADALKNTGDAKDIDPTKLMAALGDPSDLMENIAVAGTEEVEGIATDHVTGDVDMAALVAAIARIAQSFGSTTTGPIDATKITDATKQLQKMVTRAEVELWVGREDKQLHRFKIHVTAVLDEDTRASSGLDGLDVVATMTATPAESPDVATPSGAGTVEDLQKDILPVILAGLGG